MSAVAAGDRVKLADTLPALLNERVGQEGTVEAVLGPLGGRNDIAPIVAEATRLGFGEQYADDALAIFVRLDSGEVEALTSAQVSLVESAVAA